MATTLALLEVRVQTILADTAAAIWVLADIDEAIRQALHEYSKARPLEAIGTLTVAADTHELSITTLTGLFDVTRVWCPYTASDPEEPPEWVAFEHWKDAKILYFPDELDGGDIARIFYTKIQTLNGLDAAGVTTFPDDDETLLAEGAAGFAATSRAVDVAEQVTIRPAVAVEIRAWGRTKLGEFRAGLKRVAQAEALRGSSHVGLPRLDRHDGKWA
jgi:hypothetical protein